MSFPWGVATCPKARSRSNHQGLGGHARQPMWRQTELILSPIINVLLVPSVICFKANLTIAEENAGVVHTLYVWEPSGDEAVPDTSGTTESIVPFDPT